MPDTLRLSEHFVSPQGEGPRTGTLTQFVRFAGCNMRCPLWPCDTQYAIEPSIYLHDTEHGPKAYKRTPDELAKDVARNWLDTGASMINLTGGEPFQQPNRLLEQFIARLDPEHYEVECFSNGSFLYPDWAIERINFVMDWKLKGSGEDQTELMNRHVNLRQLQPKDAVKFVVTGHEDLDEARLLWGFLHEETSAEFWCGPAWGRIEAAAIVEYIKLHKLPWRLNVQVHNYVYEAQERGR